MIDRLSADPASWGPGPAGYPAPGPATGTGPAAVLVVVGALVGLALVGGPVLRAEDIGTVLALAGSAVAPHRPR